MIAVVMTVVMAFSTIATGEVYRVGDSDGWTSVGNVDYKNWASTKNFQVGDIIIFRYHREFHNVVRVTHENFNRCNGTAPYATMHSGNDSFPISSPGHYYFICTSPHHCESGQKVDIHVPPPTPAPIQPLPFPYPPPTIPPPVPAKSPVKSVSPAPAKTMNAPISPVADGTPVTLGTAPANAPAPPRSGGSQLVNGMNFCFMFILAYFYLI